MTDGRSTFSAPSHPCEQNLGLPRLVLEIRAHLGATATPEQVAAEVRANGIPAVTDEEVRDLWDEGASAGRVSDWQTGGWE